MIKKELINEGEQILSLYRPTYENCGATDYKRGNLMQESWTKEVNQFLQRNYGEDVINNFQQVCNLYGIDAIQALREKIAFLKDLDDKHSRGLI